MWCGNYIDLRVDTAVAGRVLEDAHGVGIPEGYIYS